jgi:anti-sigma factor RsiW
MNKRLSSRDYEALSAYLDGELPERERVKLEARLSQQADLRAGLEQLRQTRLFLRSLPQKKAPRNFTIRPELTPRRNPPRVYPILRLASVLASALFVIVIAGDLALGVAPRSLVDRFIPPAAVQAPSAASNPITENPVGSVAPSVLIPPTAASAPTIIPSEPPAAPTPEISQDSAAATEPTSEPTAAAGLAGINPPAGCGIGCATPAPTQTEAEITSLSSSRSANGVTPGTGAGIRPTDTPVPTETPQPTDAGAPMFTYGTGQGSESGSDATKGSSTPASPVTASQPGGTPNPMSSKSQVFPTVIVPSRLPPPGFRPLNTPIPGANPIQETVRPILRSSEFFLAGLAILAGLAALILRWIAR